MLVEEFKSFVDNDKLLRLDLVNYIHMQLHPTRTKSTSLNRLSVGLGNDLWYENIFFISFTPVKQDMRGVACDDLYVAVNKVNNGVEYFRAGCLVQLPETNRDELVKDLEDGAKGGLIWLDENLYLVPVALDEFVELLDEMKIKEKLEKENSAFRFVGKYRGKVTVTMDVDVEINEEASKNIANLIDTYGIDKGLVDEVLLKIVRRQLVESEMIKDDDTVTISGNFIKTDDAPLIDFLNSVGPGLDSFKLSKIDV